MTSFDLTINQRKVLDVIWRNGPIARVDIGPLADLKVMAVTRATKELHEMGLLKEDVLRLGDRGQPSRPLRANPEAAFSAGIFFSHTGMQAGLIDFAGQIIGCENLNAEISSPIELARIARETLSKIISKNELDEEQLIGVGFGVPGDFIVDRKKLFAHKFFPDFRSEDLHAEFQRNFDKPIFIENDCASAALGERMLGTGQAIENFFLAFVGHGIGGGMVIDGRLYRGARGNSGIIGVHFPIDKPRPSGQDLLESLNKSGLQVEDFQDLDDLRPQSCAPLKSWINRAAEQLRHGLWLTARTVDPDAIIIGGRLPHHILQELALKIDNEDFCNEGLSLPRPRILASTLGASAGMVGAAAVPIYQVFGIQ